MQTNKKSGVKFADPISTSDIPVAQVISPDILAVADLFASMKQTLSILNNTFGKLGDQTEKMASLGSAMKATEQVGQFFVSDTQSPSLMPIRSVKFVQMLRGK